MPKQKQLSEVEKQSRHPNFRNKEGVLYLVRCFLCDGDGGRENYLPAVASGQCAWCGWKEAEGENKWNQ